MQQPSVKKLLLAFVLLTLIAIPTLAIAQEEPENQDVAWIRFANFASDVPSVDFYINGQLVGDGYSYLVTSGRDNVAFYAAIPAGDYDIAVVPTGDTFDPEENAGSAVSLTAGDNFIIAIYGSNAENNVTLNAINESNLRDIVDSNLSENGIDPELSSNVLVFNVMNGQPIVDVVMDDGTNLIDNLSPTAINGFGGTASTDNTFFITDSEDNTQIISDVLNNNWFSPGLDYLVVLSGDPEDPDISLTESNDRTIADIIRESELHTTLEILLDEAGLMEAVGLNAPFTIFAPTDTGFADTTAALGITVQDLIDSPEDLNTILGNHIVNTLATPRTLLDAEGLVNAIGNTLGVDASPENFIVSTARIDANAQQFIVGRNGILYVIDAMLFPDEE